MSEISKYTKRLSCRDSPLNVIDLFDKQHTDAELTELVDYLVAHPNVITDVRMASNQLTNTTGVKLARYLAVSCTIYVLNLSINQFSEETYLALTEALRVNSSLRYLFLDANKAVDQKRIDVAFVDALRLNPVRPSGSVWSLYLFDFGYIDFGRLKDAAGKSTPPSMLEFLLYVHLDTEKIEPKKH